jgi:hypothetical protein
MSAAPCEPKVDKVRSSKAARAMLCAPSFFGEGFMA